MSEAVISSRRGRRATVTPAYRLEVASRSLAAVIGGFALASASAWMIAAGLLQSGLQPRGVAIGSGTLVSWIFWTCGAMWAFYAPTQLRAWSWLLIPAAVLGGIGVILGLEV
jgi:hypothetical protein